MITKRKMVEVLEQLTDQARQMPDDTEFYHANYSEYGGAELFLASKTLNTIIGRENFIYVVTPWEDYDMIEISIRIGSIKLYALYTEEEFKKFREMEKTPDAATSEVKEEEFAERMNDLRNLLLPDIVTPADEEVKEERD